MNRPRYKNRKLIEDNMDRPPDACLSASTCFAHLILAGTSAWAFKYCDSEWAFSYVSYILLFGHSVIGAAYYGHPQPSNILKKICKNSSVLVESCPIPFLATQLFLLKSAAKYQNLSYVPALTSALPITSSFFINDNYESNLITDITVGLNLCVLLYFAIQYDSPWAYGLFTLGVLNQFVFSQICQKFEVPRMDLVAIGLTFFCIFSINTLSDAIF